MPRANNARQAFVKAIDNAMSNRNAFLDTVNSAFQKPGTGMIIYQEGKNVVFSGIQPEINDLNDLIGNKIGAFKYSLEVEAHAKTKLVTHANITSAANELESNFPGILQALRQKLDDPATIRALDQPLQQEAQDTFKNLSSILGQTQETTQAFITAAKTYARSLQRSEQRASRGR